MFDHDIPDHLLFLIGDVDIRIRDVTVSVRVRMIGFVNTFYIEF